MNIIKSLQGFTGLFSFLFKNQGLQKEMEFIGEVITLLEVVLADGVIDLKDTSAVGLFIFLHLDVKFRKNKKAETVRKAIDKIVEAAPFVIEVFS